MLNFFRKTHRWIGLVLSLFVIMFAISGIFLNHRQVISKWEISRSSLPKNYHYYNWNNASVKGTLKLSPDSILIYGGSGVWLTDSTQSFLSNFTEGMKRGSDNRWCENIVRTASGELFAVTTFDLYQLGSNGEWQSLTEALGRDERLSDVAVRGDTLVVISRSELYVATAPYNHFTKIEMAAPEGYVKDIALYRLIWTLHSGEAFGTAGRLFVDFIGLLAIFISISGVIVLLFPSIVRKIKDRERRKRKAQFRRRTLRWHNKLGVWFLFFLLLTAITGMFLRPPAMITVIKNRVPPILGTLQNSNNPWFEKLRTIRYDTHRDDWLINTSEGLYQLQTLASQPQPIDKAPPISVMGLSVFQQLSDNRWAVGSFSGLYYWDRETGRAIDATKQKELYLNGAPTGDIVRDQYRGVMGNVDVSGYSNDFHNQETLFSYSKGALALGKSHTPPPMPQAIQRGKMSLWHLSLETHTGRIYTFMVKGVLGESIFITLSGLLLILTYISGYIVYRRLYRKRRKR